MLKLTLQFLVNFTCCLLLLLILVFPYVNFKISLSSVVFPAAEIIIIYYLISYRKLGESSVAFISLFIDQLTSMPLGCNMLAYMAGGIFLRFAGKWFIIKEYVGNFLVFSGYCLVVFLLRYLVFASKGQHPSLFETSFQYLITVFSYPLFRGIIHKILLLCRLEA